MADEWITRDRDITLPIPADVTFVSVALTVEIEPADAGCLIYGWQDDGDLGFAEVRGPKAEIEFPMVKRDIFVKFLGGLQKLSISVRGRKEADR